jgi:hypothetical protein
MLAAAMWIQVKRNLFDSGIQLDRSLDCAPDSVEHQLARHA